MSKNAQKSVNLIVTKAARKPHKTGEEQVEIAKKGGNKLSTKCRLK